MDGWDGLHICHHLQFCAVEYQGINLHVVILTNIHSLDCMGASQPHWRHRPLILQTQYTIITTIGCSFTGNLCMQVIQIPIANCSSHSNCTSCLESGNPLCGWCVVENKCSEESECQSPETRWNRASGTNTDQCITISIAPQQLHLDALQIVNPLRSLIIHYFQVLFTHAADLNTVSEPPSFSGW